MPDDLRADIDVVQRIDAVPVILDVVCRVTGMGFAAIARVTDEKWIACATRDDIQFGLQTGGELDLKSTICDEICAESYRSRHRRRSSRSPLLQTSNSGALSVQKLHFDADRPI